MELKISEKDYRQKYNRTIINICESRLILLFGNKSFENFPFNVRDNVKESFKKEYERSRKESLLRFLGLDPKKEFEPRSSSDLEGVNFSYPIWKIESFSKSSLLQMKFDEKFKSQHLVFLFNILEGFLLETVRDIFQNDLSIFCNYKRIKLSGFTKQESENRIHDETQYFFKGNFSERIKKFNSTFDSIILLNSELLDLLNLGYEFRNCITHNSERISGKFTRQFPGLGLQVNDDIKLSDSFLEIIFYTSMELVSKTFESSYQGMYAKGWITNETDIATQALKSGSGLRLNLMEEGYL